MSEKSFEWLMEEYVRVNAYVSAETDVEVVAALMVWARTTMTLALVFLAGGLGDRMVVDLPSRMRVSVYAPLIEAIASTRFRSSRELLRVCAASCEIMLSLLDRWHELQPGISVFAYDDIQESNNLPCECEVCAQKRKRAN